MQIPGKGGNGTRAANGNNNGVNGGNNGVNGVNGGNNGVNGGMDVIDTSLRSAGSREKLNPKQHGFDEEQVRRHISSPLGADLNTQTIYI